MQFVILLVWIKNSPPIPTSCTSFNLPQDPSLILETLLADPCGVELLGTGIRNALYNVSFHGITGLVSFDSNLDRVHSEWGLYYVQKSPRKCHSRRYN